MHGTIDRRDVLCLPKLEDDDLSQPREEVRPTHVPLADTERVAASQK